jgi:hypothetical protein
MADSGAPDAGITCLQKVDNQVLTFAFHDGYYASQDGGLSWEPTTQEMPKDSCVQSVTEIVSPLDPQLHFKFTAQGHQIERSDDGGHTWQVEHVTQPLSEAQQIYAARAEGGGSLRFFPDLFGSGVLLDASTGNLIVAAGHQGVLVRTPDGIWRGSSVGRYAPIDLHQPENVIALLADELVYALVVFALSAATMTPGKLSRKVRLLLMLGWLALGGAVFFKLSFFQGNYSQLGSQFSVYGAILAGLLAAIAAAIRLTALFKINPKAVWATLGLSALAAGLFLVPFIVWSQNGIPFYVSALLYAVVLVAVTCYAAQRYLRRYNTELQFYTRF